jgi:hypothetical protein
MRGAINKAAEEQYRLDMIQMPSVTCSCVRPAVPVGLGPVACCVGGTCQFTSQCSKAVPAGDAAADTGADAVVDAGTNDAADVSAE